MSFSDKRQELASAVSAVHDVRGHVKRPSTPAEGDAWPVLGPLDRAQGTAFLVTWRLRILLPPDEEAASAWIDAHWPYLFEALAPHGYIQRAAPVMLAAGGGELYAFEITMIAEE